jgi:mannose-6-phosphate isomerase-like protein (cupin superfamily)
MLTSQPFDPKQEHFTSERCFIAELLNDANQPTCSIARARVGPGVTTQLHCLDGVTERYVILSGTGRVEVGGASGAAVAPSTIVHIAAGVSQRITNTGTEDLIFLCVCTPRFTVQAYRSLE